MKGFLKYRGEWVVAGINARLRRLLSPPQKKETVQALVATDEELENIPLDRLPELAVEVPIRTADLYVPYCHLPQEVKRWMNVDRKDEA